MEEERWQNIRGFLSADVAVQEGIQNFQNSEQCCGLAKGKGSECLPTTVQRASCQLLFLAYLSLISLFIL